MHMKQIALLIAACVAGSILSACGLKNSSSNDTKNVAAAEKTAVVTFASRDAARAAVRAKVNEKKPALSEEQKKYDAEFAKRVQDAKKRLWTKEQATALQEFDAIVKDKKASADLRYSVMVPWIDVYMRDRQNEKAMALADRFLATKDAEFAVSEVKPALLLQKAKIYENQRLFLKKAEVLMERLGTNIKEENVFKDKLNVLYYFRRAGDNTTAAALSKELFDSAADDEQKIAAAGEILTTANAQRDYNKIMKAFELYCSQQKDVNKIAEMKLAIAGTLRHGVGSKPAVSLKLREEVMKDPALNVSLRVRGFHDVVTSHIIATHSSMDKKLTSKYATEYMLPIKNMPAKEYAIVMRDLIETARFYTFEQEKAAKYAESMLAYPEMAINDKVFATIVLAELTAEKQQFVQAEKIIDGAFTLGKLPYWPYFDVCKTKAKILRWQEKCDEAVKFLKEKMVDVDKNYFNTASSNFVAEIANTYLYFHRYEDAAKTYQEYGYPTKAAKAVAERLPDLAKSIARKVLTDEKQPVAERAEAATYFLGSDKESKAFRQKYPQIFQAATSSTGFSNGVNRAVMDGNSELLDELVSMQLKNEALVVSYRTLDAWMQALAVLHKFDKLDNAAKMIAQRRDEDPLKQTLIFVGASLKNFTDKPGSFSAFYKKCQFPAGTTEKQKADALLKLGLYAHRANMPVAAQEIYDTYIKMFKPEPRKTYMVKFSDKPVRDMSGFLAMMNDVKVEKLDRKYGGNMDFLVTDVSTGDRGAAIVNADAKAAYKPCEMRMICDEFGLHMLFVSYDKDAAEVEAGNKGAGSFEMYLAPGENQPYSCYLPNLEKETFFVWESTYNTAQWRQTKKEENDVKTQQMFTKDGYILYMFFSWNNFYDKLPECSKDFWEFENIFWSRFGGYSWNGIKNIHGRSTFGLLKFDIDPAQLRKIKRHIIIAAKQSYLKEQGTTMHCHGVVDMWKNDNVFGDSNFFKSQVAPITDKLDADVALVNANMSDEVIDKLFQEDVPGWFEIRFIISAKRQAYLEEQLSK